VTERYGVTVRIAVDVPPFVAEIVTAEEVVTTFVLTLKVAVVAPPATVTFAGTVATTYFSFPLLFQWAII
jgi:hypothetical protein